MLTSRFIRLVAVVLYSFILISYTWAESSYRGILSGRVVDPQKAAVSGAKVTLINLETKAVLRADTDQLGQYTFFEISSASYSLAVAKEGFKSFVSEKIDLSFKSRSEKQILDVTLELAGSSETVTVIGSAGPVSDKETANKMDIPLRETPVTVNTVNLQMVREQGSNDLVSALRNVSGVNAYIGYGLYEYYVFRGFGFGNSVQLVDGIRNEGNRINTQLTNIEKIEVLKGPASILYGSEAMGGVVNLVRKKPSATPDYEFSLSAGKWNSKRASMGATGPLGTDSLLYRFDAGYSDTDGWRHAPSRRVNATPALYWKPTENDRLNIHFNFNRDRFATDAGIPLVGHLVPDIPYSRRFNTPQDFALSHDYNLQAYYTHAFTNSTVFRDTVAYRHFDDEYLSAEFLDVRPPSTVNRKFLYFHHHRRPVLNQAELLSQFHFGVAHRFLAGWEFERYANVTDRSSISFTSANPIDLYNPVETHITRAFPLNRLDRFRDTTNALYFQDHISLHQKVKLLTGGRFDIYRRWSRNDPITGSTVAAGPTMRREIEAFTSRLGFVYQTTPWFSLYGSYASAFKPVIVVPQDLRNLEPEKGRQFELGNRFEFLKNHLSFSTAIYDIIKRNVTFSRGLGIFDQAGKQRSRGFEIDIEGEPLSGWKLSANYGYTAAKFLNFLSGNTDLSGNRPNFVPRNAANWWTTYTWKSGLGLGIGGRYLGSVFSNNLNSVRLGGYTVWDSTVFLRRGAMEYSLNLYNALNKTRYFTSAINDTLLYPGRPIDVLITMRYRFNPTEHRR